MGKAMATIDTGDSDVVARELDGIWIVLLVVAAVLAVVVGQAGRELLPPDDLREAEVAREMWLGGDYVIPHLAGLPFVEKPPAFPAAVAAAYAWAGHPSTGAARAVSTTFALATLLAVFLLGRLAIGLDGAGLAVALLGLSARFCRTAHLVLLDNGLTAAIAFALLFTWMGLAAEEPRAKRRAYAAAGLALGLSFLFKGFVGPALFGAGLVTYLATSRRFQELRLALGPLPIAGFLAPMLLWVVPFVERASPAILRAFFVENHVGRAVSGFASNIRPPYYYALDLWLAFAPACLMLPFAAFDFVRGRARRDPGAASMFFLAFGIGPLLLLSLPKAKDSHYALPAFPALALFVADWSARVLRAGGSRARAWSGGASGMGALAAAGALFATVALGGLSVRVVAAGTVLAGFAIIAVRAVRRADARRACAAGAALFALAWMLWFTGPIAAFEVSRRSVRHVFGAALAAAGQRTVLLYRPDDGTRGGASFWRNRTAEEEPDPVLLIERLSHDHEAVALLRRSKGAAPIPRALLEAAAGLGVTPVVEARFLGAGEHELVLMTVRSPSDRGEQRSGLPVEVEGRGHRTGAAPGPSVEP